ncbi:MAG: trypsin-like peptidase domain-containing protein [Pseudomonadota bacterium]
MTAFPAVSQSFRLTAAALLAAALLPDLAQAAGETAPRRILAAHEQAAFRGVGRLDIGDGYCTATLFSETQVLTAAHCLFDANGQRREDATIWFRAGFRDGVQETVRQVRRSAVHPDYVWNGPRSSWREIAADVALVELDAPVLVSAIPNYRPGAMPEVGGGVALPSYGRGRDRQLSLQDPCRVLARDGAVATLDCKVDPGSSGSPILAEIDGELRLVAVLSAAGRRASYAAVAEDTLPLLQTAMLDEGARRKTARPEPEPPRPTPVQSLVSRLEGVARSTFGQQKPAQRPAEEDVRPVASAGFGLQDRRGSTFKSSRPPRN